MLGEQPEVDRNRIFLFGHSEGCYISPLVHQRSPVKGIILLTAPAERLDEVRTYQAEGIKEDFGSIPGVRGSLIRFAVRLTSGSDSERDPTKGGGKGSAIYRTGNPFQAYKIECQMDEGAFSVESPRDLLVC